MTDRRGRCLALRRARRSCVSVPTVERYRYLYSPEELSAQVDRITERADKNLPTLLQYRTHIKEKSLYHTPPTFAIYVVGLVMEWIELPPTSPLVGLTVATCRIRSTSIAGSRRSCARPITACRSRTISG